MSSGELPSGELPPVPSRPHRHADFSSSIPVAPARPASKESLPTTASAPILPQIPTKRPTRTRTTDLDNLVRSQESLLQEEKQRLLRRKELELEKRKLQHADRDKELGMLERRREALIREKEREEQLRRKANLEAERSELEQLEKEQQLAMERLVKLEDAKRRLEKKNVDVQSTKNNGDSTDDVVLKKAEPDFHTKVEDAMQEPEIPRRPERSKQSQTQDLKRQPMIPQRRPQSIGRRSTEPILGINRRPENLGKYHINEENIEIKEKSWIPDLTEQPKCELESEQYSKEDMPRVPDKAPSSRKDDPGGDFSLVETKTGPREKGASADFPTMLEQRPESLQKKSLTTKSPNEEAISNELPIFDDREPLQENSSSQIYMTLRNEQTPLEEEARNLEEKFPKDHLITSETKSLSDEKETERETLTNEHTSSLEGRTDESFKNKLGYTSGSELCLNNLEKGSNTVKQSPDRKVETGKQISNGLEMSLSEVSEMKPTEEPRVSDKENEKPEVIENIQRSDASHFRDGKPGGPNGEQGEQLKKKAPPVPKKKPSSRIAAFQEMLRKQQMADAMHGSRDEAESTCDEQNDNHKETEDQEHSQPSVPQRPARHPMNADRSKFANNLSGIFALPGMSPIGGLPPSFAKKLGPVTASLGQEGKDGSSTSSSVTDVRSSRARGPRGRKLPSKVAQVEKVNSENKTNQIEIFTTWKTVSRKREEMVGTEGKSDIPVSVTIPTHFDLDEDKTAKPLEGSANKEHHINDSEQESPAPSADLQLLDATRGMEERGLQESSTRQESSDSGHTQPIESSVVNSSTQEQREKQHEELQSEVQPVIPERPTRHTKRLEKVEEVSNPESLPEQCGQSKHGMELNVSDDSSGAMGPVPETTFFLGDDKKNGEQL